MSVKPCASWIRRQQSKKIEAIALSNLARFKAEDEAKAKAEAMAKGNLVKKARESEALRLAAQRLSRSEWEQWCGQIGDIARNGRGCYTPEDMLTDLRKWGSMESGRFIRQFDRNHIQPAVRLG
jgi:hypothetical protein